MYPQALLKVILSITDVRIIQYALTLIRDFVEADPERRVRFLTRPGGAGAGTHGGGELHVLPFLQLVGTSGSGAKFVSTEANPYVVEQAAIVAAHMTAADPSDETATSGMLAWVLTNLKLFGSLAERQVRVTEVATESLMLLLRSEPIRALFIEERGYERLIPMLGARNTQLLYDALFCLWILSLQRGSTTLELENAGATTAVARLVRVGMPLKVLRVGLACLVNIAKNPQCTDSVAEICETHVPEVVATLLAADPPVSDPELLEDLKWLKDNIATNVRQLSSFERYEKEVNSRVLEWTAVHSSDFFKENAVKMEAGDFRVVRALKDLLTAEGTAEVTTAVALHDLGEFAVHHPHGKQ